MKTEREVKFTASDPKNGMTLAELEDAVLNMSALPGEMVPIVTISISGRIKSIKVMSTVVPDA